MRIVYLRFHDSDQTKSYAIHVPDQQSLNKVIACAEYHGLSISEKLVGFAAFIGSDDPNLKPLLGSDCLSFLYEEWIGHWKRIHSSNR